MEEVVDNSTIPEVAPQQTENHVDQQQEAVVNKEANVASDEKQKQNAAFAELRRQKKDLEKELRMQRELMEQLVAAKNVPQAVVAQEVDEFETISDDEFIPKGKVKKLLQKEKDKIVKEALQEVEKRIEKEKQGQFLTRLKSQFSDFDEVVNPETLSLLEEQDPELANTIAESKDPYKIYLQAYKYIKASNLIQKAPEARRAKEVEKKLEQNSKTVPSPQAYDKRPLAQAYVMTESDKNKLYQEMLQYARMA